MFIRIDKKFLYCTMLPFLIFIILPACENRVENGSVKAEDALSTFQVAEGFKIEMIASEPLISDPVDMEIDEYGRMYVVEMHGYPLDKSGSGKIILLSDEDGDGIMDKRTVFNEGLVLPTSVMRWKKGILVTDAPNLLYLEDTDGDGVANRIDTVLTGFALSNPQHNVNSPVYGLDNWIYVAHEGSVSTREYKEEFGDEGSEIVYPSDTAAIKLPKNANGRSIRFRPENKKLEMLSSRSQFGHTFDEWGHLFACNNSNQGYHEVIANRYFERNPDLIIADATHSMSDHLNAAEVFPTTTHPDRQLLTNVGVMTSACGLTSYQGGAFPEPYNGKITFIAEPVSNLVHVDILRDSGASYSAGRILQSKEFFSSTDAWSRPVNLYVGPDGALYVLDYYRKVIESPEWMSEQAIAAGGLYDGMDMGRIYRISPVNGKPADWTKGLKLVDANSKELVQQLANKNNWWRLNAQRLLVDRADKNAVPELLNMAQNPSSEFGKLHALWTLQGMNELKPDLIKRSLKDSVAGIRENAIRLAELYLDSFPDLEKELLALQNDPDPKVRFQLLLTLGFIPSGQSAATRNNLLFADIEDKWVQIAALTASSSQTASLLDVVLAKYQPHNPAYGSLVKRLTTMVGSAGNAKRISSLIDQASGSGREKEWSAPLLEGLADGLKTNQSKPILSEDVQRKLVQIFFSSNNTALRSSAFQVLKVNGLTNDAFRISSVKKALELVNDKSHPDNYRAQAVDFISLGDVSLYAETLKKMITPQEGPLVQLAAVRTLSLISGTSATEYFISQWPVLTPEIRDAAIGTFLVSPERINLLLKALESDKIKTASVSFPRSVQLMQQSDSTLRNRARFLFTRNEEEGKRINKEYQRALTLKGDAEKGKKVYVENCAICHQVRGKMGVEIGPDLGTIHNWTKEDIMANVLDPNLSIASGFDMWEVEMNNGELASGIIASETPVAITLRNNGKLDRTINRQDIKVLRATDISAMPTGLDAKIDHQQMADLLEFLRQH